MELSWSHPTLIARLRLNQDMSNKTHSDSPFLDKLFTENVKLLLVGAPSSYSRFHEHRWQLSPTAHWPHPPSSTAVVDNIHQHRRAEEFRHRVQRNVYGTFFHFMTYLSWFLDITHNSQGRFRSSLSTGMERILYARNISPLLTLSNLLR